MNPPDSNRKDPKTAPDPFHPITEKQLARLWERRTARHRAFRSESGREVRVLYPGRPGVTAGPDFRDALLLIEGQGLVAGDVEIHLRQRDWQSHGHHDDPNYNGVALHVALQPDPEPSRTVGGSAPPTLNLTDLVANPNASDDPDDLDGAHRAQLWRILASHGYRQPRTPEQMRALLNRAGDERFLSHSRRFTMLMSTESPEQTLWESICDALGYRHNRHPFRMLATAAPWPVLAARARMLPEPQRQPTLASWLLSVAGFESGPTPRGLATPLDPSSWRLFRVRPSNHPRRRILGAAALASRFCQSGIIRSLEDATSPTCAADLIKSLSVPSQDGKPAPIGAARARDIAVNTALPFQHAYQSLARQPKRAALALDAYRDFGALADNEITRQLAAALQDPAWGPIADNARRQQGLIHLQRLLAGASPHRYAETRGE